MEPPIVKCAIEIVDLNITSDGLLGLAKKRFY